MKLLIWGIGNEYKTRIEPYDFLLDQNIVAGYLDNDSKWEEKGSYQSKKVLKPKALLREEIEWDFILLTSPRYQSSMLKQADEIGIPRNKLLLYPFLYPITAENFNYYFRQQFETEDIKIMKEWYVKDNRKCLIFSVENKIGKALQLRLLRQGALGKYHKDFHAVVMNLQNDETEFAGKVNRDAVIVVPIRNQQSVFRLEVEGLSNHYIQVEVKSDLLEEHLGHIFDQNTKNYFKQELSRIYDLTCHENDYTVLREFSNLKDFTLIDVGANLGQSSLSFLRLTDMEVCAFEPYPGFTDTLDYIQEKYKGRFHYYSCGVGMEKGELKFYQPKCEKGYAQESSFNPQKAVSRAEYVLGHSLKINRENFDEYIETTQVPVVSLDSVFCENQRKPVLFVKIDAETFEEKVLCGMKEIIKRFLPLILVEYNDEDSQNKIVGYVNQFAAYHAEYWDSNECRFRKENVYSSINYFLIPQNNRFFRVSDYGKIQLAMRRQ